MMPKELNGLSAASQRAAASSVQRDLPLFWPPSTRWARAKTSERRGEEGDGEEDIRARSIVARQPPAAHRLPAGGLWPGRCAPRMLLCRPSGLASRAARLQQIQQLQRPPVPLQRGQGGRCVWRGIQRRTGASLRRGQQQALHQRRQRRARRIGQQHVARQRAGALRAQLPRRSSYPLLKAASWRRSRCC